MATNTIPQTPEAAALHLNDVLIPQVAAHVRRIREVPDVDDPVTPFFRRDHQYFADGVTEGSVSSGLLLATTVEPWTGNRYVQSLEYSVGLHDYGSGLVGVSMNRDIYRHDISDPEFQQLLGSTFLTLAAVHSMDPELVKDGF